MTKVTCDGWTAYRCKRWPGHEGPCALVAKWWFRPVEWLVLKARR